MTRVVCRLLTTDGQLLGWTAHEATIRGDGAIRASHPVVVTVDADGVVGFISWHWVDVNIEARVSVPLTRVIDGAQLTVSNTGDPIIVCGEMPQGLPAVTVRSVSVGVPVGQMGVRR